MGEIFNFDGKFSRTMQTIADVIIVSILWVIGCIPIITIGTSTTALYYASIKAVLGEGSAVKNFFKSYKVNLKQSIVVEVILIFITCIMYADWLIITEMSGGGSLLKVLYCIVLIWLLLIVCYLFPILARFELSTKLLFAKAFVMSFKNLPKSVFIILTSMFPIVCLVLRSDYVFRLLPLLVMVVPGLIAYLNSMMFVKIFEQYMPKDETEEKNE